MNPLGCIWKIMKNTKQQRQVRCEPPNKALQVTPKCGAPDL